MTGLHHVFNLISRFSLPKNSKKFLIHFLHELVGWEKCHIIPRFCLSDTNQVSCIPPVHLPAPSGILRTDVHPKKKPSVLGIKRRFCINRIIFLRCTEKLPIIMDWEKCCRKEHGTVPLIQKFLQTVRRIHAEQAEFESPCILKL